MLRTTRFLYGFLRQNDARLEERELVLNTGAGDIEATLLRPARSRRRLPGWVVLHGITVPGRKHDVLLRFARSLALSGAEVLLPDIPAWRDLQIDPGSSAEIMKSAVGFVHESETTQDDGVRLVGFSFGATQAIVNSTDPELRDRLRSVVGFGGYCDLGRTMRCMMTGIHEWDGREYRHHSDPYGRWIIAENYLDAVPGLEHMEGLRVALKKIAKDAGERRIYAGAAVYDSHKTRLRAQLQADEQEIWDVLAPPSHQQPDLKAANDLADRFSTAAIAVHPKLDPYPYLPRVRVPVRLAHGVEDALVPFTEMWRLHAELNGRTDVTASLTKLFAHSTGGDRLPAWEYPREIGRYLWMLNRALK